jgi:hypothetical protein
MLIYGAAQPAVAQVAHENPANIRPSSDVSIEDQMKNILDFMQVEIEDISINLREGNFTSARESYLYLNESVDIYQELLWRMNLSDSAYEAIVSNINFTRDELYQFIQNSEIYDESYVQYNQSISTGDTQGAGASAHKARLSYDQLTAAYDRLRANTTRIEQVLMDNNIDTEGFEDALNNINSYMIDLSARYSGIESDNRSDFRLTIDPTTSAIGGSFKITTTQMGMPAAGSEVNIYFNSILVGTCKADSTGVGSMSYVIPANISKDVIYAHAEAIPASGNKSRLFSNAVILRIQDKPTGLSLLENKGSMSYGDPVRFSGELAATDGTPAPGKAIDIYMNGELIGSAMTGEDGAYAYVYNVTPGTPAGKSTFYASYKQKPEGVFLGSASMNRTLEVIPKNTILSVDNDSRFSIGDIGRVKGKLVTENNVPVRDASVLVFIDGIKMGNNSTDSAGAYNIVVRIPDNWTSGPHEVYASFTPDNGTALRGASSDKLQFTFSNSVEAISVSGVSPIVFRGDTLSINGTLRSGSGMPIEGKSLNITASAIVIGTFVTDSNGYFNASYVVSGGETPGLYTLSIAENNDYGLPPVVKYSGQLMIIPFDKFPALGAPILVVAAIIAVAALVLMRTRRDIRFIEHMIVETTAPPEEEAESATLLSQDSVGPEPSDDMVSKLEVPHAPVEIDMVRAPPAEEKPLPKLPPITQKQLTNFSMDSEIISIKAIIRSGDLMNAMTHIYVTSRKIALVHGVDVPDSMTHNEFLASVSKQYPPLDKSLSQIVYAYELMVFGGREADASDLNAMLGYLGEFYRGLQFEGVSRG